MHDPPNFMPDAIARTKGALMALKKSCEAQGCALAIAPSPSHSAVNPDHLPIFRDDPRGSS